MDYSLKMGSWKKKTDTCRYYDFLNIKVVSDCKIIYIYIYIYIYVCVCVYIYIYIYMCVCVCILLISDNTTPEKF